MRKQLLFSIFTKSKKLVFSIPQFTIIFQSRAISLYITLSSVSFLRIERWKYGLYIIPAPINVVTA